MRYDEDYVAGLKARISALEEALEEAVYLTREEMQELLVALACAVYMFNPTEEDMQRNAGVYRVVTAFEKLQEKDADEWYEKALWGDKLKEKKRSREEFLEDLYAWANKPYKWVGLTDDEFRYAIREWNDTGQTVGEMICAIEAKLKEKNA